MEFANLILNVLLIAMLGAVIYFIMRLHNRLEIIRSGKNDLEALLETLVTSTANAEAGLKALRVRAEELTDTLGKQVAGAENAREELSYLLTSSERTANELLRAVEKARQASVPTAAPAPAPTAAPTLKVEPRVEAKEIKPEPRRTAEDDLLKAIETLR